MGLIVLGGLGFLTLEELVPLVPGRPPRAAVPRVAPFAAGAGHGGADRGRLGCCSRLFEWNVTLDGMPLVGEAGSTRLFMSVTPRTAGFNSIDYARGDRRHRIS